MLSTVKLGLHFAELLWFFGINVTIFLPCQWENVNYFLCLLESEKKPELVIC